MNILTILLSLLALTFLITIHELGHFLTAKAFNVYVNEFAIGMGPKLFSKKKGETTYSIRAIPIGGFVSMYGEGMEEDEETKAIPQERSLLGIKKWKRAIIMLAGITMNFVVGYVLFFANAAFCEQYTLTNQVTIVENSKIEQETEIRTGDYIVSISKVCSLAGDSSACEGKSGTFSDENPADLWNKVEGLAYDSSMRPKTKEDTMTLTIGYQKEGETEVRSATLTVHPKELDDGSLDGWEIMGVSSYYRTFRYRFGEAFVVAGKDWVEGTTAIARGIGQLFTGKGWDEMGGVIQIVSISSSVVQSSFGQFLWLWGLISVNLAIFNLLPFPGLDGWHFVVIIVEAITRKEFPQKVKGIISLIGMALLFGLMIYVTIKDIIRL